MVDNASADGSADAVRARDPEALVIANAENVGLRARLQPGLAGVPRARTSSSSTRTRKSRRARSRPSPASWRAGRRSAPPGPARAAPTERSRSPRAPISRRWRSCGSAGSSWASRAARPGRSREAEALHAREHEPAWVSGSCLARPAHGARGRRWLRRALLPLRGGRRPVPPPARGRLGRRLHSRGRGEAPPRPQHVEGARGARASSTTAATCSTTRKHNGPLSRAALRILLAARGALAWLAGSRLRRRAGARGRPRAPAPLARPLVRPRSGSTKSVHALGRKRSSCYCSSGTCRPRTREDRDRRAQVERLRDRDVRPQRRPPPRAVRPRDHVPPLLQPGRRADAARPRGELRPGGGRLGPLRPARAPLDPAQAAPPRGGPPPRAPLRPAAPVHGAVGGDDPRLHPPPLPAVPARTGWPSATRAS